MSKRYDAVIIGAGVIGACVAFELTKKGYRTLSVDKNASAGYGSTSGSCAIIRTYYSAYETCAVSYEGWFYWKDWPGYLGATDPRGMAVYNDTGCLVVKTTHNKGLTHIAATMDRIGCPYEHLTPAQMRARLPILDLHQFFPPRRPDDPAFGVPTADSVDGGIFFPRGGYVSDPALTAQNVEHAAKARGAEFRYRAEVVEVRRQGNRVAGVTLADGSAIDAPIVVNVAGPHSSKINRMAGVYEAMKMKTRALRHEVAHVPAPEGFDFEKLGCVYSDSDIATYARPELGNHILIGSEDPACDTKEWVDPDHYNREFTEQWRVQALRLAQRIPSMGIPSRMKGIVDLYDVTEDWIPIYDKSDLPGFYVAIGTSGNQFKNAPVAGKMMTHLIEACETGRDHDKDPVGFHLDHIDRDVSIGFFSRNRDVNPNSSFSVLG
jgi:sarcosine oxidase subunit beta